MSDDEVLDDSYRAYEDELYKDEQSDDSDVDSEIEECLYAQVHHSSTLTLISTTLQQNKAEADKKQTSCSISSKQTPPVILVDTASDKDNPTSDDDDSKRDKDDPTSDKDDPTSDDNDSKRDKNDPTRDKNDPTRDKIDSTSDDDDSTSDDDKQTPSHSYPEVVQNEEQTATDSSDVQVIEESWQLAVGDKLDSGKLKRRYYGQYGGKCFNCNERGHLSRDCPLPKKQHACFLCGQQDHERRTCPNELCFNCNKPGHKSRECREPFKRHWDSCHRCYISGHVGKNCPDEWRRFHITTNKGLVVQQRKDHKTERSIFCFNCAKTGHFGHECSRETMTRHTVINIPFVVNYGDCATNSRGHKRSYTESNKQELKSTNDGHHRVNDQSWKNGRRENHHHHRHKHEHHNHGHKHNHGKQAHHTDNVNHKRIVIADNLESSHKKKKKKKRNSQTGTPTIQDHGYIVIDETPPPPKRSKKTKSITHSFQIYIELNTSGQGNFEPDLRHSISGNKGNFSVQSDWGFRSVLFKKDRTRKNRNSKGTSWPS